MDGTWTLDDLSRRVTAVLDATGLGETASKANGQVSDVLVPRTIRYYTTIGVLDRPRTAGRQALYGQRHLEQIVAIKRLQAQGKTLADVQAELLSLDDAKLTALAAVPAELIEQAHGPVQKVAESRREGSFWGEEPAEPQMQQQGPAEPVVLDALAVTGVQLSDGVTLAFPAARAVDDDDREALRAALQNVVEIMRARGLLETSAPPQGEDEP